MLLLRYDDPPPMGVHWSTPGGGIDVGETAYEAAVRELREETGWADAPVGAELGRSQRLIHRRAGPVLQHETHFLVRVQEPARAVGEAGHAVDEIAGWRWFSAAELAREPYPVWPAELRAYLSTGIGDVWGC